MTAISVYVVIFSMLAFLHRTTTLECPEDFPCDCLEENGSSLQLQRRTQTQFNIIQCEGQFDLQLLNFSLFKSKIISRITFFNTSIEKIDANTFQNLNVKEIEIKTNSLINISEYAFAPARRSLEKLTLENVGLVFHDGDCMLFLKNLTNLRYLNLDRNYQFPLNFPGGLFRNLYLISLEKLSLRKCGIVLMSDVAFQGLESLSELDISINNMSIIPSAILSVQNLQTLKLSHNTKIYYIPDGAFHTLHNLKVLEMSHTGINTMDYNAFKGLEESLEELYLDNCDLPDGHFDALKRLQKLRVLDISNNRITHIHNVSFEGFVNLENLDLSANPLLFLDTMFRGVERKLKVLSIKELGLTSLPLGTLDSLLVLETLDASRNDFREIYESFFTGIRAKTIFLKNMKIDQISANAFEEIPHGIKLFLDGNSISSISFLMDLPSCTFHTLSLEGNPVSCDCDTLMIISTNRVANMSGTCAVGDFAGKMLSHLKGDPKVLEHCNSNKIDIHHYCLGSSGQSKIHTANQLNFLVSLLFFSLYING
ncbi:hypothetical protein CHS0354_023369 [Potamilus streckersoni]|uniref:Toll-like receptor 2 n=1 Tax=Potamilus streckersoni TaxID=2493646 RepID=A0AAE0T4N7_9BIVA|nr:hypothetical protein CHS0354_023369 [Potamilus streckersoni]